MKPKNVKFDRRVPEKKKVILREGPLDGSLVLLTRRGDGKTANIVCKGQRGHCDAANRWVEISTEQKGAQ